VHCSASSSSSESFLFASIDDEKFKFYANDGTKRAKNETNKKFSLLIRGAIQNYGFTGSDGRTIIVTERYKLTPSCLALQPIQLLSTGLYQSLAKVSTRLLSHSSAIHGNFISISLFSRSFYDFLSFFFSSLCLVLTFSSGTFSFIAVVNRRRYRSRQICCVRRWREAH
jgi:hypothetical protein